MIRKAGICFTGLLIIVTCAACGANAPYAVRDYLHDLALSSGLSTEEDVHENIQALEGWGVLKDKDYALDEALTYGFLFDSLGNLLETDAQHLFAEKGLIKGKEAEDRSVDRQKARELIAEAVRMLNSQEFSPVLEYEYAKPIKQDSSTYEAGDLIIEDGTYKIVTSVDEDGYQCSDATFEEIFSDLEIADTYTVDFSQAEVIPYGTSDTAYQNENYELLANKKNSFEVGGFKVTYTLSGSGIDLYAVNSLNGFDIYAELAISNVRPSFRWFYREGDLKNCYFDVSMHTSQQLGVSTGKYGDYYLKFKDLDSSSFMKLLDSMIDPVSDEVDTSIPLCRIRTPIPNLPTADLCLDVLLKIAASGKIELLFSNDFELGFETKDGQVRYIHDHSSKAENIIEASGKAGMGLNVALEALACRLADVELDGGIQAKLKSTVYLYDEDGKASVQNSPVSYSALREISQDNEDVKVCGDVSLHWMMDLIINTAKSKMNKLGFSKTLHLLDDDDQLFGNLHHIENGQFVKKCTRKDRVTIKEMDELIAEKIVLDSYAEVLHRNGTYQIVVKALPEGYKSSDLLYSSRNEAIATVSNGLIRAVSPGSVQIRIDTRDGRYSAYVNILVSTG